MAINRQLLEIVKLGFVPPGGGGDPAAGGQPPGAPPGGDPAAMGGAPPMDPAAAGGLPPGSAPPPAPGLDPQAMQQIVQQAVQQAMSSMGMGGAAGAMGAAGAKPKGAGKPPDETAQQLYKLNALLMMMARHLDMPIPDEMFLGPQPGTDIQQAMATPPADPNAQQPPGQDPNAAATGPQPVNIMPSVAMPQQPTAKMASEEDNSIEAELVRSFGSTFSGDVANRPTVELPLPPWAKQGGEEKAQEPAFKATKPDVWERAQALVALLKAGQQA